MVGMSPSQTSAGRGRRSDWARLTGHTVEAWPSGEHIMTDQQVERVISPRPTVLVEFIDRLAEPLERVVVVELALHEADALGELLPDRLIERGARVGLDRLQHLRGEVLVLPLPAGKAHQGKARRQQPAVGEVVHGRHELLAGEVTGYPKQDQRRRPGNTV